MTEKPSVAREFATVLKAGKKGKYEYRNESHGITITHCIGHLLEAAEPQAYDKSFVKWKYEQLPIIPREIKYVPRAEAREVLESVTRILREGMKGEEEIVIATDAGREGEVIARLVVKYAGLEKYGNITRFWESEALTEGVIKKGLKKRKSIREYDNLARVGLAWKTADWIYGINITRLYSLVKGKMQSIGRVQTAVLNELYKREKEREEFVAEKYVQLVVVTNEGCRARLVHEGEDRKDFETGSKYVQSAFEKVNEEKILRVVRVDKKEKRERPPKLFNINELQREAYRVYGYEPQKTAEIAQRLYEVRKTLSYPRTPSRVMGEENIERVKELYRIQVENIKGLEKYTSEEYFVKENKRLFNNAELEDHHALVPLAFMKDDDTEEYRIWNLVQVRFLMQAMEDYVRDETKVRFVCGKYAFAGAFTAVTAPGWKILDMSKEDEEEEKCNAQYMVNEMVRVEKANVEVKQTNPKPLYDYDTILGFMENPRGKGGEKLIGIGTPATRASILDLLKKRKYIGERKRKIMLTREGRELVELIRENELLRNVISAETTTEWERISEQSPAKLVEYTRELVFNVVKSMEGFMATKTEREVLGTCPACGGSILEGDKNYYCANYKQERGGCKQSVFKHIHGVEITKEMMKTLLKLKTIGVFEGINKDQEQVSFGLRVDEKEIIVSYFGESRPLGACPQCGRRIFVGKKNYYCEGYTDKEKRCDYIIWKEDSGARFTSEMVRILLSGGTVDDVECHTKDGVAYKAGFKLDAAGGLTRIVYGGRRGSNGGK